MPYILCQQIYLYCSFQISMQIGIFSFFFFFFSVTSIASTGIFV